MAGTSVALVIAIFAVFSFREALSDGVLDLLKEALLELDQKLASNHKDQLLLPKISANVLVASVEASNGSVGNFSTIALSGDDQFFNQTDYSGYSVFDFDLELGLAELRIRYDFSYSLFGMFKTGGQVEVITNTDAVKAQGSIASYDSGNCTAVLNSAWIASLGTYRVNITPSNLPRSVVKGVTEFVANYLLPIAVPSLNAAIMVVVKEVVPFTEFSKIACKPFVP